jgi:hypothetical protein
MRVQVPDPPAPQLVTQALHAIPLLAEGARGFGPFKDFGGAWLREPDFLRRHPYVYLACEFSISRHAWQLLTTAASFGPLITLTDALAVCPGASEDIITRAAQELTACGLCDGSQGFVVLTPTTNGRTDRPGIALMPTISHINSDTIAELARRLGLEPGARKDERIDALQRGLRDPTVINRALANLTDEARAAFEILMEKPGAVSVTELGVDYYMSVVNYPRYRRESNVIDDLMASGLIGVDSAEQTCWVWLDVVLAMRGGLYDDWVEPTPLATHTIAEPGRTLPRLLVQMDQLLDLWTNEPAMALKTGGIAVKDIKRISKTLGISEAAAALLVTLAISLRLIISSPVLVTKRGRSLIDGYQWHASSARGAWDRLDGHLRWAHLVQAWISLPDASFDDYLTVRRTVAKALTVRALQQLPIGQGATEADLSSHLAERHHGFAGIAIHEHITQLRLLGVVPSTGPVGLSELGRLLMENPSAVGELVTTGDDWIIVQADLTITAPAHLDLALTSMLESIAIIESDGGARIYRLDEARISRTAQAGTTTEAIMAALGEHSRVPISQNVERYIADAVQRAGRLTLATAGCYLVSTDSLALAEAAAVRAAHLTIIAPTVAVSSLSEDVVRSQLRAKGIVLTVNASLLSTQPDRQLGATVALPPLAPVLIHSTGAIDTLVRELTQRD